MSEDANRRLVLAKRPSGMIDSETVRLEEAERPSPGGGEALARVRWISIDPTIRTWMDDAPGYLPPIGIGEVVRAPGVAEVVSDEADGLSPGDLVFGMPGWQEYVGVSVAGGWQKLPPGIEPTVALSVLGVTGMTAYFGMPDVGRVKE